MDDSQWSDWHEQCDDLDGGNDHHDSGFKDMCRPFCICSECGVILFECDVVWVVKKQPYRAEKFNHLAYNLTVVTTDKSGVEKVACCRHCGSSKATEELYDDFGTLPDCMKDVAGFGESRRLALGSLYCRTFKPSNYSIEYSVTVDHLKGIAGLLQFEEHSGDITAPYDKEAVLPLYTLLLAQLETLYCYFPTTTVSGSGNPLPMLTGDVEIKSGKQLTAEDLRVREGMIIEADPFAKSSNLRVDRVKDLKSLDSAGVQRFRKVSDADLTKLCASQTLSLRHPKIEEKLFPHLYPYGIGGYDFSLQRRDSKLCEKCVTHTWPIC